MFPLCHTLAQLQSTQPWCLLAGGSRTCSPPPSRWGPWALLSGTLKRFLLPPAVPQASTMADAWVSRATVEATSPAASGRASAPRSRFSYFYRILHKQGVTPTSCGRWRDDWVGLALVIGSSVRVVGADTSMSFPPPGQLSPPVSLARDVVKQRVTQSILRASDVGLNGFTKRNRRSARHRHLTPEVSFPHDELAGMGDSWLSH